MKKYNLMQKFVGKWHAANSFLQFFYYFHNWSDVWSSYRSGKTLPPLTLRNGITLNHSLADDAISLFREIFVDECYTAGLYRPKPSDTVIDIGANIGLFALYLQWQSQGVQVHCFEPSSETRKRLTANIAANNLAEYVHIYPYAVSDRKGQIELKLANNSGQTSLFSSEFTTTDKIEIVQTRSLADVVQEVGITQIDLLKIDAEGSEIEIVEGADREFWQIVKRVVFEYHDCFRSGCKERVLKVLTEQGFTQIKTALLSPLDGLGVIQASR